jgi:hypothetical protein
MSSDQIWRQSQDKILRRPYRTHVKLHPSAPLWFCLACLSSGLGLYFLQICVLLEFCSLSFLFPASAALRHNYWNDDFETGICHTLAPAVRGPTGAPAPRGPMGAPAVSGPTGAAGSIGALWIAGCVLMSASNNFCIASSRCIDSSIVLSSDLLPGIMSWYARCLRF